MKLITPSAGTRRPSRSFWKRSLWTGPHSGHTALLPTHLSSLGRVNRFLGRLTDGERYHHESYLLMRKQYGAESAIAANQQTYWAYALTETGPMDEAARQASEALTSPASYSRQAFAWDGAVGRHLPTRLGLPASGEAEALAREGAAGGFLVPTESPGLPGTKPEGISISTRKQHKHDRSGLARAKHPVLTAGRIGRPKTRNA